MRYLYSLGIFFYSIAINIAAIFNNKARLWVNGRKNLISKIKQQVVSENIIWFHTASVGEFEQARPLIERIKRDLPQKKILITFFSPSAFQLHKNYELADYVFYLPLDTIKNARKFLNIVNPEMIFFVKYEFWFNFINEINKTNTPLYLISGIFRKKQHFFKWYGYWFKRHLQMFNYFFVQNKESARLLSSIGITTYSITGDTRFDRVKAVTLNPIKFDCISEFKENEKILLCGSTWPPDEAIILEYMNKYPRNLKIVIAPHEVTKAHIKDIEVKFKDYNPIKLSAIEKGSILKDNRVLIIDSVGKLIYLYQYADITYVGGGFGVGIHNILEATCYAKPVIFGPNYSKFQEAHDLLALGGAFSVNNASELVENLNLLVLNEDLLKDKSKICINYVQQNIGATDKIYEYCFTRKL